MIVPAGELVKSNSLAGTALLVHGGPTIVVAIQAVNNTGGDAYIQLFDFAAASSVTLGTTISDWTVISDFGVGTLSTTDGLPTHGLLFKNGVVAASTTTATGLTGASQHLRLVII